jgi:hypothetical protein
MPVVLLAFSLNFTFGPPDKPHAGHTGDTNDNGDPDSFRVTA